MTRNPQQIPLFFDTYEEAIRSDPQPLVIEHEAARLQREFVEAVKALEGIRGEMARLQGMAG